MIESESGYSVLLIPYLDFIKTDCFLLGGSEDENDI